jgi:hypothetical protein
MDCTTAASLGRPAAAAYALQLPAVTLNKAPPPMTLMLTAKLVALSGIVSRRRPVTHPRQFCRGEQL